MSYRQKAPVIFRLSDIFSDVAPFDDWLPSHGVFKWNSKVLSFIQRRSA